MYILYAPTTRSKYKPKCNIKLKPLFINPLDHKVYKTHHNAMTIANLVVILCKTEYNNS